MQPTIRSFLGFSVATIIALPAGAQYTTTYDWHAHSPTSFPQVKAGETIELSIKNLNRVCFTYTVNSAVTNAANVTWADLLKNVTDATIAFGKIETAPAASATSSSNRQDRRDDEARRRERADANAELTTVFNKVTAAFGEVEKATNPLEGTNDLRTNAKTALDDFPKAACAGERGSPSYATIWTATTKPAVEKYTADAAATLPKGSKEVAAGKASVDEATAGLTVFRTKAGKNQVYREVLDARAEEVDKNERALTALKKRISEAEALITSLTADAKAMSAAAGKLDATITWTTERRVVATTTNTASVTITVVATGIAGPATGQIITDELLFPVYRRHRGFAMAGFMVSGLRDRSFDRANLVDSLGQSYSTFVNRSPGSRVVAIPTLTANITLFQLGGVDLAASGGLALRTVADKAFADVVLGPTISIGDMAALSFVYHRGREEELLLGDEESVRKKAVPDVITRSGAVGYRWANALALVFGLKVQ